MDVDYEPPSSPPKPRRPVISVFDWDDTVCPSSWLHREGLLAAYKLVDGPVEPQDSSFGGQASESSPHEMSPGHRLALHQFEEHVIALLQYARQFGPVFIVTAAKLQWVRSCAEYFLPRVLQTLIKSETVHVISAREFYLGRKQRSAAPLGPGDEGTPLAWKATTFNAICTHLRVDEVAQRRAQSSPSRSSRVNFISVGDSFSERDACRMLELSAPSVMRSKTVKYLEQPHVLELMDQVRMTRVIYEQICRHAGGLDLHMVRSRGSIQVLQVDTPGQAPSTARSNPSPRRHSVATGGPIGARTPL
ncbi:hypothetical protein Poli38472_003676 [Pythium oligandrum]|uniref:Uncharacterized protein n=1 Tax=Pythium oligandrum TaxID=41045 RepID=A0A8K1FKC7_PYTOL|nr:hypothetical protein Poli38472_003676 [Pythium oligandrum]|eukprot:TMW65911.1 hypothetical protein Poli38472_003676 [Pythium oligandrum]